MGRVISVVERKESQIQIKVGAQEVVFLDFPTGRTPFTEPSDREQRYNSFW
jgi:hypothetical protein